MTTENRDYLHRLIYIHSLLLAAVALPVSEFLLSLSQFFLVANWLIEGQLYDKWKKIKTNKPLLLFLTLFFTHIIWLLNTCNFQYAIHDIRIKLPLLVFPVIISSTQPLNKQELLKILKYFTNSVFVATLILFSLYLGCCNFEYTNTKNISIFISHIRFSLMITFSIFIYLYFFVKNEKFFNIKYHKIAYIVLILWKIFFLLLLQARTGILIFFLILPIFVFRMNNLFVKKIIVKYAIYFVTLFFVITPVYYVYYVIKKFYDVEQLNFSQLPKYTPKNNIYYHNPNLPILENGHYVWTYISYPELEEGWKKLSKIPFDSLDKKGQKIKFTLIRYLTSKGLTKDAKGISQLSLEDVKLVENGETNYLAKNKFSIYYLIYKIIWQIDVYLKIKEANNYSLIQRYEYLKVAFSIIRDNFWFGTGTGDVYDEYLKKYKSGISSLDKIHWHRAHNQIVTFFVTFGIVGFVIAIISIILPPYYTGAYKMLLFNIFFLIIFLSFLNEDTLETQMGVTFFSFFYTIFVFGYKNSRL